MARVESAGVHVEKGDSLVIPAGAISLSLDPGAATGRFSRHGVSWFVQNLFLSPMPEKPGDLAETLDHYIEEAEAILRKEDRFSDIDFDGDWDIDAVAERLDSGLKEPAFWAVRLVAFSLIAKGSLDRGELVEAAWASHRAALLHCMLTYASSGMEELLWRGYTTFGLQDLEAAVEFWDKAPPDAPERYWQKGLRDHSLVLSQLFAAPTLVIDGQPYVGGKGIDDFGGNVVDFLVKNELTGAFAFVEIKKPKTQLLAKRTYRDGIYAPLTGVVGAISQALGYRDSFVKEYYNLAKGKAEGFPYDPTCIVVVGHTDQLDDEDKRRSFELFRRGLKDVQMVTFDELFGQAKALLELIRRHPEIQPIPVEVRRPEGADDG